MSGKGGRHTHRVSTRLQVSLTDDEAAELRAVAAAAGMTVSEWVRGSLRASRRQVSTMKREARLDAIARAVQLDVPAPDIGQMLAEIETGYAG
jgi:hypothetical protein